MEDGLWVQRFSSMHLLAGEMGGQLWGGSGEWGWAHTRWAREERKRI